MTTSVYDKHDKAFNNVSAYLATKTTETGTSVIRVKLKYPKDGAGRLTAYVHLIGQSMVIGTASGYGYDKASAAVCSAFKQIAGFNFNIPDDGFGWETPLTKLGWTVYQVI